MKRLNLVNKNPNIIGSLCSSDWYQVPPITPAQFLNLEQRSCVNHDHKLYKKDG